MTTDEQPPTGRSLLAVWLIATVVFGGLLAAAELRRGPLDGPGPAQQRPGILDLEPLPQPAPTVIADIPQPGRAAVVFFSRLDMVGALCGALSDTNLAQQADLVIVIPHGNAECGTVPVVEDADGNVTQAYDMRSPSAGGSPTGYAVVDNNGQIRYRTLDPDVVTELREVRTIVAAL